MSSSDVSTFSKASSAVTIVATTGIIAGGAAIIVIAVLIIKCIQQRRSHSIAAEEQSTREQSFHEPNRKDAGGRGENSAVGSDSSSAGQNPWSTIAVEPSASSGTIITRYRS